ncbi:hypothetical protein E5D57_001606 [Metarhizium anisopliae]|nr:hypothetical protein E5D57_001606 [Metarhizium anisopliae]
MPNAEFLPGDSTLPAQDKRWNERGIAEKNRGRRRVELSPVLVEWRQIRAKLKDRKAWAGWTKKFWRVWPTT